MTAAPVELVLPPSLPVEHWDVENAGIGAWTIVSGDWTVDEAGDAPSGRRVLAQRAVKNAYNVIIAPAGPYTDCDVSVKFKPISGQEDASAGIVLRFGDGTYYVLRANALEDNFRLYSYDTTRRQLATATVEAPALGRWHTIRAVIVGDHMQGWLDGRLLVDHRDARFRSGRIGLWTKADSVTVFDQLTARGSPG